ncbi:MAG: GNAT family N-acetyltransferase [Hyphomicrobium sp.]
MNAPMLTKSVTRLATAADIPAISALHARVFGPGRFTRSAYRVREGNGLLSRFCRVVEVGGHVVAAVRITEITVGGAAGAALLGPIAVHPDWRNHGYGQTLINDAVDDLKNSGVHLVVLVGDESYYGRCGFKTTPPGQITFPGPVSPTRILATELTPDALARYCGVIAAASAGAGAVTG